MCCGDLSPDFDFLWNQQAMLSTDHGNVSYKLLEQKIKIIFWAKCKKNVTYIYSDVADM